MKDKRMLVVPVAIVVIALVGWIVMRNGDDDAGRISASGTIEGTEADLGFQLGGRVAAIAPREGDRVTAGDILARLEQNELNARRAAAVAQAEAARLMDLVRMARARGLAPRKG